MKTRARFIILALLLCGMMNAQELNCNVSINSDYIEGSNKSVFNTLQQAITEYINNTRWTGMTFAENEKIECSMAIVVKKYEDNLMTAEMQLQARRPVYGTSYTTPLLNLKDNYFNFVYQEYDRLDYQENIFTTNLTAMLAYYCYLIIGIDMDSYSRLGGTPYFQTCENIVNAAITASMQDSELTGWYKTTAAGNNRNRYAIANNLMDESYRKFREYFYEYHRLSLDEMTQNVANARARIVSGMEVLRESRKSRPGGYLVGIFLDSKADELVNLLKKATADEKKKAYEILNDVDPTRQQIYD